MKNYVFGMESSVFVKHFYKVVDEKSYDKDNFKQYWIIMTGKDADVLQKFYDTTFLYYNKFVNALLAKSTKIRVCKQRMGIELPVNSDEMLMLSQLREVSDTYVEQISEKHLESIKANPEIFIQINE
jgi:hypothetical protein